MQYRYGYGMGFGFRGASPPWPYVGRGRGGMPRCWYPGAYAAPAPPPNYGGPFGGQHGITREQEIEYLKEESNAVKAQLDLLDARIKELEEEKK